MHIDGKQLQHEGQKEEPEYQQLSAALDPSTLTRPAVKKISTSLAGFQRSSHNYLCRRYL
jgi:hypothetical protein